ncbi:hypothetical protein GDO81_014334, partial [Engystomops pustulosus]
EKIWEKIKGEVNGVGDNNHTVEECKIKWQTYKRMLRDKIKKSKDQQGDGLNKRDQEIVKYFKLDEETMRRTGAGKLLIKENVSINLSMEKNPHETSVPDDCDLEEDSDNSLSSYDTCSSDKPISLVVSEKPAKSDDTTNPSTSDEPQHQSSDMEPQHQSSDMEPQNQSPDMDTKLHQLIEQQTNTNTILMNISNNISESVKELLDLQKKILSTQDVVENNFKKVIRIRQEFTQKLGKMLHE